MLFANFKSSNAMHRGKRAQHLDSTAAQQQHMPFVFFFLYSLQDNSFLLASHKDPVKRTTYLLVIASYGFAVVVVGISYLISPEEYGVTAMYPRNASLAAESDEAVAFLRMVGTVRITDDARYTNGGGGFCWIGGGVLTWGLLTPLMLAVLVALYSTIQALSFLRHDALIISEGLDKDDLARGLSKWEAAREFEM